MIGVPLAAIVQRRLEELERDLVVGRREVESTRRLYAMREEQLFALVTRRDLLVAALFPFARIEAFAKGDGDDVRLAGCAVTHGDVRRARELLAMPAQEASR